MTDDQGVQFQLGTITAQIGNLHERANQIYSLITGLEGRLQSVEKNISVISTKMAILGFMAGAVGSGVIQFLFRKGII